MKLWPVGQVRPIRFHHIRHTTASLLMMAGADLPAVQRIMRHTDPRITTEFYGHLAPGYLRGAIDRLAFESPPAPAEKASRAAAGDSGDSPDDPIPLPDPIPLHPFAAPVLQPVESPDDEPPRDPRKPGRLRAISRSGREDLNLRHSAPKADALPGCATPRRRGTIHRPPQRRSARNASARARAMSGSGLPGRAPSALPR